MSIKLSIFIIILLMVRPYPVKFSVVADVGDFRCLVYLRVTRRGTATLHPYNNAANSASDANTMTFLMMEYKVRTAPFFNSSADAWLSRDGPLLVSCCLLCRGWIYPCVKISSFHCLHIRQLHVDVWPHNPGDACTMLILNWYLFIVKSQWSSTQLQGWDKLLVSITVGFSQCLVNVRDPPCWEDCMCRSLETIALWIHSELFHTCGVNAAALLVSVVGTCVIISCFIPAWIGQFMSYHIDNIT